MADIYGGQEGHCRHCSHTAAAMAAAKLLLVSRIMRTRSAEVHNDDHLPTAFNALERGYYRGRGAAAILFQTHALC